MVSIELIFQKTGNMYFLINYIDVLLTSARKGATDKTLSLEHRSPEGWTELVTTTRVRSLFSRKSNELPRKSPI